VTRDGERYVVSVWNCDSDAVSERLPVMSIDVNRLSSGGVQTKTAQCQLWSQGEGRILESWVYGTAPAGYVSPHCVALERGTTYALHVGMWPVTLKPWNGHFAIDSHGDVHMMDRSCKE
jgi:hypothetical protein